MSKPIPPCSDCGTLAGHAKPGQHRPRRFDGRRYGFAGQLCQNCMTKHWRRANGAKARENLDTPLRLARERQETPRRVAIVREAKIEVSRKHGRTWLTDAELDAVLPMEVRR